MGSTLPPKEANQFKLIVKAYETKQYKKGLKAADSVLKKFPNHGETLAMKGLILNCLEKKSEAYELVRKGLKNDLKSHVCWHVYGLLYRSDRDYREAIKCYRNALRMDPQNQQILKDLSLLQIQMRDKPGFVESRRQLLTLKPNNRGNWIAFAIAEHVNGNLGTALSILEAYEGTLDEEHPPASERYEHSELMLYKVKILQEAGRFQEALEELAAKEGQIIDRLSYRELHASLLVSLSRPAEARRQYEALLDVNPDDYRYFEGLQSCLGLLPGPDGVYSEEKTAHLKSLFTTLQTKYPKSNAAKRIPLDFLRSSEFGDAVDVYIRPFLKKGIPSLFSDLEPLYEQQEKAAVLESVFLSFEKSLRSPSLSFPPSPNHEEEEEEEEKKRKEVDEEGKGKEMEEGKPRAEADDAQLQQQPLLWLLFFLAQHHAKRGHTELAVQKIDEAIAIAPKEQDLYLAKARILRAAGDAESAALLADSARQMDTSDRFLNSETVGHMLGADQVDLAVKTAALFTKDGEQHSNSLIDMQCMWYELATADSHLRQNKLGRALKNYLHLAKHYNDMVEDQFDFHTYCLRKMTLRSYLAMLRFEDTLHSNESFRLGAEGAIRCYLALHDSPSSSSAADEAELAAMSAEERRKFRQKQRKAEAKAKKEAEEKLEQEKEGKGKAGGAKKGAAAAVDTDPEGAKLLEVEDKLGEALKPLNLLLTHARDWPNTWELAFEVQERRGKPLLCLQAVKRLVALRPNAPSTHVYKMRFFNTVTRSTKPKSDSAEEQQIMAAVVYAEQQGLGLEDSMESLKEANKTFLEAHQDSLLHRAAAAEVSLILLSPPSSTSPTEEAAAAAAAIIESSPLSLTPSGNCIAEGLPQWTLQDCISVHRLLQDKVQDSEAASRWNSRCTDLFPFSTHFGGAKSGSAKMVREHVSEDVAGKLANGIKSLQLQAL